MKKERIVIVGAGGFGRELISWVHDCAEAGRLPACGGFIDDRIDGLSSHHIGKLGSFSEYKPKNGDRFLLGVGDPATKRRMVESLRERGAQFAKLVHPTAIVGRNAIHGEGVIMCPFTMNTVDTHLDDFVTLLSFSGLGHDASAGPFTTISSHVDVMGHVSIGAEVFVGSGARIMPGLKIGDRARIGAAAFVMRGIKPDTTVFSPPAKLLRLTTR